MTAPARPGGQLSELETQVLRLAASGKTIAAIAHALGSTTPAVQDARHRLMAKLGARNITHAVHIGHSRGLLWRDCEGDRASYLRHLHRGEPTHAACRAANARHTAEQRAARLAAKEAA
ncbi:response regulator transcription factor [Streptomyces erythrochromogenes]|uniref:response regulator transcription factor n=1 Tax=Streptomyces erythrochromogenes TaxID=285574 RepID=UPI00225C2F5E|nr:helix-turn-helix transcriptional regulator [Streptomyces erythrochromogenes]MCX5584244.1 helix-turn-helix transcriptional regulator [Streptomyces erythrochromogenes]